MQLISAKALKNAQAAYWELSCFCFGVLINDYINRKDKWDKTLGYVVYTQIKRLDRLKLQDSKRVQFGSVQGKNLANLLHQLVHYKDVKRYKYLFKQFLFFNLKLKWYKDLKLKNVMDSLIFGGIIIFYIYLMSIS